MTTKEYLYQIEKHERIVDNKLSELYQLRSLASDISISCGSDKVQTSSTHDKLEKSVIRILKKQDEVSKEIEKYLDKKEKIINQINNMEDETFSAILYSRYVKKLKFKEISEKETYSIRQVFRIHDIAIKSFERQYGRYYL